MARRSDKGPRPPCPRCGETDDILSAGTAIRSGGMRQRWSCGKCGYGWVPLKD